ncbi:hypothetical protein OH77DRAFT_1518444 [Trametes cingulata]|nr:hypothetical protein OH77DRAFT_1518444 [Trametes cingulata]
MASSSDLQPIAPAMHNLPPSTQHPSLPSSSSSNSENTTPIPSGSAAKKPTAKRKRTGDEALKRAKSGEAFIHLSSSVEHPHPPPPIPGALSPPTALADQAVVAPAQYISPEQMYPAYAHPGAVPVPVPVPVPASYGIPAEAANLEYSILSAILGGSPDSGSGGSPVTQPPSVPAQGTGAGAYAPAQSSGLASAAWPAEPYAAGGSAGAQSYAGAGAGQGYGEGQQQQAQPPLAIQPSETTLSASSEYIAPGATTGNGAAGYSSAYAPQGSQSAPGQYAEYPSDQSQPQAGPSTSTSSTYPASAQSPPSSFLSRPRRNPSSPTTARLVPNWSGTASLSTALALGNGAGMGAESAVQSVYKSVTKGYDYTEGYHFLMKHLSRRFEKNDILRIVRALAIVRPSFIALQMPMTEEDEVFVEKCFQRSLIELDKLVSFSGTPTVAWRRTGEICLVGPEFCMLTGWEREELVGRRKYIYELFENQSVVEYWENFANHAFENTTQSVYSHCVLLKPSGAPVPCTFCFSIRRDIMDLPSLVIGQWLPLL